MPKHCAYGLCNTDSRYPKTLEGGVEFLPFPKPKTKLDKCREWIKQCGRPHSQLNVSKITKNTCSKHFVNGRPTSEFPNPIAAHRCQVVSIGGLPETSTEKCRDRLASDAVHAVCGRPGRSQGDA
ncbi:hypothetical protein N1851_023107 [Merluccius polli]|uniref:THAP-type domain-containing protein n=1 Tax=Merluccius polli TaxID=89951 RepID=A0AA47NWL4_MERPO|nr:hypothetical protein N1851_023107 [Merluccius polli]